MMLQRFEFEETGTTLWQAKTEKVADVDLCNHNHTITQRAPVSLNKLNPVYCVSMWSSSYDQVKHPCVVTVSGLFFPVTAFVNICPTVNHNCLLPF